MGIDNGVIADKDGRLENGPGHDLDPFTEFHIPRQDGGRVNHVGERIPELFKPKEDFRPGPNARQRPDPINELDALRGKAIEKVLPTQYLYAEHAGPRREFLIEDSEQFSTPQLKALNQHLGVAATPEDYDWLRHPSGFDCFAPIFNFFRDRDAFGQN